MKFKFNIMKKPNGYEMPCVVFGRSLYILYSVEFVQTLHSTKYFVNSCELVRMNFRYFPDLIAITNKLH
jgi:hypothetical protein